MIIYADYEYYRNTYLGNLSKDLFDSLVIKASRCIDRNVNRKITEAYLEYLEEDDLDKIKYTACELCDYYNSEGSDSTTGKAKSISIDGVSKTLGEKTEGQQNNAVRNILDNLPHELTRYL